MRTGPLLLLFSTMAFLACREAAPTSGASSAQPASVVDVDASCAKVCRRATACGVEAAENLAKANASDAPLVETLRKDAKLEEEKCAKGCVPEPKDEDHAPLLAAGACLEQPSCETFEGCMDRLAQAPR